MAPGLFREKKKKQKQNNTSNTTRHVVSVVLVFLAAQRTCVRTTEQPEGSLSGEQVDS